MVAGSRSVRLLALLLLLAIWLLFAMAMAGCVVGGMLMAYVI